MDAIDKEKSPSSEVPPDVVLKMIKGSLEGTDPIARYLKRHKVFTLKENVVYTFFGRRFKYLRDKGQVILPNTPDDDLQDVKRNPGFRFKF